MKQWTLEDVLKFREFLQGHNRGWDLIMPVKETMNGQFLLEITGATKTQANQLYEEFTKEVLND